MGVSVLLALIAAAAVVSSESVIPRDQIIDNGMQTTIAYNSDVGPGTMAALRFDDPRVVSLSADRIH